MVICLNFLSVREVWKNINLSNCFFLKNIESLLLEVTLLSLNQQIQLSLFLVLLCCKADIILIFILFFQ